MATMLSRTARSFISRTSRRPVLVLNNNASSQYLGARWMSSYPDHEVIGMPSLSPVSFILCHLLHMSRFAFS